MNEEEFALEWARGISSDWERDRHQQEYTQEEVAIATVLSRLDIGLACGLLGYLMVKTNGINIGVWVLVVLNIVNIALQVF
jgi:hypothetical protein